MARQSSSGTVTDPGGSAPTAMASLMTTLRSIIPVNPAWQLVETINGSTNVVDVYKCLASASGLPKDFYVILLRVVATGDISSYVAEDYNATTHAASNCATKFTSSARTLDTSTGLLSPSVTLTFNATTGVPTTVGILSSITVTAASTITYFVVTDSDHMVLRLGGAARYAGAFDSLVTAVSDPMPIGQLCLHGQATGGSSLGGAPRNPGFPSSAGMANTHAFDDICVTSTGTVDLYPQNSIKGVLVSDPFVGAGAAYEVGATNASANPVGALRGRLKKVRKIYTLPVGTAVGDTFTIAAKQWVVVAVNAAVCACLVDPGP